MATYKAIERGHDGKRIREEGETFEFDGKPGKWMEKVEPAEPKKKPESKDAGKDVK